MSAQIGEPGQRTKLRKEKLRTEKLRYPLSPIRRRICRRRVFFKQIAAASQLAEKTSAYQSANFEGRRILLAEDNALNAEIAITILEEAGFTVEHAADGIICVDMLKKADAGYYDLILMDIQMPNMDGYKATQTIRKFEDEKKAGITIIAMTANAFEGGK